MEQSKFLFPRTKMIGRDRAHACQRLLRHPWKAEMTIKAWMEETVLGQNSVCQKIWNSHTYSAWFGEAVSGSDFSRGKTLSAAKHRFCSLSKPLGTFHPSLGCCGKDIKQYRSDERDRGSAMGNKLDGWLHLHQCLKFGHVCGHGGCRIGFNQVF